MYVDVTALDQEAHRLSCLMADFGMEHITVPTARSPQEEREAIADKFATELAVSYARIAAAGSDEERILPSLVMAMAVRVAALAAEISLRSDRDVSEVIRSIDGR